MVYFLPLTWDLGGVASNNVDEENAEHFVTPTAAVAVLNCLPNAL